MSENNVLDCHYVKRDDKIYHEETGIYFNVKRVFLIAQSDDNHFEIGFLFYRRANQWHRELRVDSDVYAQLVPFMELLQSLSNNQQDNIFNDPDKFCDFISDVFQIHELY